jgi:hypothetical protein
LPCLCISSALVITSRHAGHLCPRQQENQRTDSLGHIPAPGGWFRDAALTVLSGESTYAIAVQMFGGIGAGLFAALTPIRLADATRGMGRYNLS